MEPRKVEYCSHHRPAAIDRARARSLSAISGNWGKASESGNRASIDAPELRKFRDQGSGYNRANAWSRLQDVVHFGELRVSLHDLEHLIFNFLDAALENGDQGSNVRAHVRIGRLLQASVFLLQ